MRKFLSIVLAVMMLVSLYAVNVSASVETIIPAETIYVVNQNYEDTTNNTDVLVNGYGAAAQVTLTESGTGNHAMSLDPDTGYKNALLAGVDLGLDALPDAYTLEFDVLPVDCSGPLYFALYTGGGTYGDTEFGGTIFPGIFTTINSDYTLPEGSTVKGDEWWSFRLTVDESKITSSSSAAGLTLEYIKDGMSDYEVLTEETAGDYFYKNAWRPSLNSNSYNLAVGQFGKAPGAELIFSATPTGSVPTAADVNYHIDNVKISYVEAATELPAKGVLYHDEFEGSSNLASTAGSIAYEGDNGYLKLYTAKDSTWGGTGVATATSIPEKFILTMDVYKEADCTKRLVVEYWETNVNNGGTWGQVGINAEDVEAGKWYRLKIAKTAADRTYTATVEDLTTGNEKTVTPVSNATEVTSKKPGQFLFRAWNGTGIFNWRVDNIVMTECGAVSMVSSSTSGDTTNVKLSVDAQTAAATPILATYNEGVLVDIDYADNTALAVDGAKVEFTVNGAYDKAVVYIWDSISTGVPLIESWDITSELVTE